MKRKPDYNVYKNYAVNPLKYYQAQATSLPEKESVDFLLDELEAVRYNLSRLEGPIFASEEKLVLQEKKLELEDILFPF